jgi:hypothetical protein
MSEVPQVEGHAEATAGQVLEEDETPFGSASPVMAAKSQAADRDLLDAFLSVRSRTRGPLVAVNERTMITNLGASELLQPADRRLLWAHATTPCGDNGGDEALVLCSGVEVTISAQLVGGQVSPKGAVLHLSVECPALDATPLASVTTIEAEERPGANRSLDPKLMTGWTDLTEPSGRWRNSWPAE